MHCPICHAENEEILLQTPELRVIAVHNEANAPAFCRVIWQQHVAEMTDLSAVQRQTLMETVYRVEAAMRQVFRPAKINLASLGNGGGKGFASSLLFVFTAFWLDRFRRIWLGLQTLKAV